MHEKAADASQKDVSPTRRSRKIPDLLLAFWRDQRVWSSSFNLPSPVAHSTQVFKIAILGVFKIGLLGDAMSPILLPVQSILRRSSAAMWRGRRQGALKSVRELQMIRLGDCRITASGS